MLVTLRRSLRAALAASGLLLGACTVTRTGDAPAGDTAGATAATGTPTTGTPTTGTPAAAPTPTATQAAPTTAAESLAQSMTGSGATTRMLSEMRLEVDTKARQLHVYKGDQRVATHPVAVGSSEWPTKTGEWYVTQVVFNPEWIPPDESWAEQRERRQPGDPKNPLGRAQLIYDPPRTIHGTNEPTSIGKAVSHGSIRLANEVIVRLARQAMEEGGAAKDEAWFQRVQANPTQKEIVDLPQQIPIRVF
jgi:lipoprotein-anchoring transpeptidase ErfK/SrfK